MIAKSRDAPLLAAVCAAKLVAMVRERYWIVGAKLNPVEMCRL